MNERLKLIRIESGLSQEDFGKKIGIESRAHISMLENGKRTLTDRIINDICREFGVNELWLRTGTGEKKKILEGEERFALNIGKLQNTDNETLIRWANAIAETNPELLEDIESFFMNLLGIKKESD